MKLQHIFASCRLMKSVYVLRDHCLQLPLLLPLCKLPVCLVRPCRSSRKKDLLIIKAEEFLRMLIVKGVTQNRLWRIVVLLVVQSVHASEIRNSALRGDSGSAEKHHIVRPLNQLIQLLNPFFHFCQLIHICSPRQNHHQRPRNRIP